MLSRNIEMLDFALDFPTKKSQTYNGVVEETKKGVIPFLLQWDKRWGYASYGDNYIGMNGCAPTSLAMVIIGLTGKENITPYTVASYAEKNGYYVNGVGTSWNLLTEGSRHFGVKAKEITLSKYAVFRALELGHPIICSVRKGDFTTTGHFIVLVGTEEGKIVVHDPNSIERSNILWEYERIENQIRNLWEFSL